MRAVGKSLEGKKWMRACWAREREKEAAAQNMPWGAVGQAGPAGARTAKGQRCGIYRLGEGQEGSRERKGKTRGVTANGGQELSVCRVKRSRMMAAHFVNTPKALGMFEG